MRWLQGPETRLFKLWYLISGIYSAGTSSDFYFPKLLMRVNCVSHPLCILAFLNMPAGVGAIIGWLEWPLFSVHFLLLVVALVLLHFYGDVLNFLENLIETWNTNTLSI